MTLVRDRTLEGVVVSADGTAIAYRTVGTGPALLVVPGALAVAGDFDAFAGARRPVHGAHD